MSAPLPPYVSPSVYNTLAVWYPLATRLTFNVIGVPFTVMKFEDVDAALFMNPYCFMTLNPFGAVTVLMFVAIPDALSPIEYVSVAMFVGDMGPLIPS